MSENAPEVTDGKLQDLIDRRCRGDDEARAALIDHACDRLMRLTRKMFHAYPGLRRWENTDDVFQNSMIRLHRALSQVQIESVRDFFNLAARQIRWELLDLSKRHFGPHGVGANHHTDGIPADEGTLKRVVEPRDAQGWNQFHELIERLPVEEQELVNLVYYEGLTQIEAAKVLGISESTLKRRWQAVKLRLHGVLSCELSE